MKIGITWLLDLFLEKSWICFIFALTFVYNIAVPHLTQEILMLVNLTLKCQRHNSVHLLSVGCWTSYQIFTKGGLGGPQFLEVVARKEEVTFFSGSCNFYIKNKLKFEILNAIGVVLVSLLLTFCDHISHIVLVFLLLTLNI